MAPRPSMLHIVDNRLPLHTQQSVDQCNRLTKGKLDLKSVVKKELNDNKAQIQKSLEFKEIEFQKYLIDLKVASTLDKRLIDFLKEQALTVFLQKQNEIKSLLMHIARTKEEEEKKRFAQGSHYLEERQKFLDTLILQVSSLDQLILSELDNCLKQIEHLDNKIKSIQFKKAKLVEDLRNELIPFFDLPENKVNGKNILATDNPEDQKGFINEIVSKHGKIKEMQDKIQALGHEEIQLEQEHAKAVHEHSNLQYEIFRDKADITEMENEMDDEERSDALELANILKEFDDSEEDQDILSQIENEDAELKTKPKIVSKTMRKIDEKVLKEDKLRDKLAELREKRAIKMATLDEKKMAEYDKAMYSDRLRNPIKVAMKKNRIQVKEENLKKLEDKIQKLVVKKKEVKQEKMELKEKFNYFIGNVAKAWNMVNFFNKDDSLNQEAVDKMMTGSKIIEKTHAKYIELDNQEIQAHRELEQIKVNASAILENGTALRQQSQEGLSKLGLKSEITSHQAIKTKYEQIQAKGSQKPEEKTEKSQRISSTNNSF